MIHLHAHSHYSFLAGTLSIDRLLVQARLSSTTAVALTDTNNVSGTTEFLTACRDAGVAALVGAEIRSDRGMAVLLAPSWQAYANVCSIVSRLSEHHPPTRIRQGSADVELPNIGTTSGSGDVLLDILEDELSSEVIVLTRDRTVISRLVSCISRDNLFVELVKADEARWGSLTLMAERLDLQIVATNDVYFGSPRGHELHCLLRAISTNTTTATVPADTLAHPSQYLCSEQQFVEWFRDLPEALINREVIVQRCSLDFDMESSKFAAYASCDGKESFDLLHDEARAGLAVRYPAATSLHRERLGTELGIIRELGFTDYFLVTWDIIRYAIRCNYPYVGRGSGANSIVAYCLGITNVDPIALDLYFERFLNPERASPPDFDIDFSWRHRDDVIRYIFTRYGEERTAMIGTIAALNPRGALREAGKVLGFSDAEIRQTVRLLPGYASGKEFTDPTGPFVRHASTMLRSRHGERWMNLATQLLGFPNHYGIHSGGVILAPDHLHRYTATQVSLNGVRITQQDMYSMADWRLEKLDILSTRGLGTYEDAMHAVANRTGSIPPIRDYTIAMNDAATKALMREGRTIGCFYVESPAMIQLLRKLRTDTFEMLTAASSIIRPGVAQSGMMQAFIERYHDPAKIDPPHPLMAELLHSTFGIMVYQEDVIKVAHLIGGLRLGEADLLRRAMSGKMRSRDAMRALQDTFMSGCATRGIQREVANEIWRQMESFAGYSFCKAHSASYAVLSFQEAWLKAHFPALFLCSVLNNQGGYYRPEVYVQEARQLGLLVLLPSVQQSEVLNTCPDMKTIQLGFLHVKALTQRAAENIIQERERCGPFESMDDCIRRTFLSPADAAQLIKCGAFDSFGLSRPALLASLKLSRHHNPNSLQAELAFASDDLSADLQDLRPYSVEQVTQRELEIFSFTVSTHVLDHYSNKLKGTIKSTELAQHIGERVVAAGWMIAAKMSRTRTGERMMFVNVDDGQGMIDAVLFPRCFARFGHILHGAGPYKITGRVACEHEVISLIADSVVHLGAPDNA